MRNYLKRRFSSGDLQNERDNSVMTMPTSPESHVNMTTSQANVTRQSPWKTKSSTYTSAPSSPIRSLSFANQFMNVAREVVNQAIQQISHQQTGTGLSSSFSSSHHHGKHEFRRTDFRSGLSTIAKGCVVTESSLAKSDFLIRT
jgi:hypothetical protein